MFSDEFLNHLADAVADRIAQRIGPQSQSAGVQKRLLNTREAAVYLGMPSESSLRQRKCAGHIPDSCVVKLGGSVFYDRLGLDEWIADLKMAA